MQIVRTFSDDIHMEYGVENWAKTTQEGKKLVHLQNLILDINREIQELQHVKHASR
jgi:hypothetical protein